MHQILNYKGWDTLKKDIGYKQDGDGKSHLYRLVLDFGSQRVARSLAGGAASALLARFARPRARPTGFVWTIPCCGFAA